MYEKALKCTKIAEKSVKKKIDNRSFPSMTKFFLFTYPCT